MTKRVSLNACGTAVAIAIVLLSVLVSAHAKADTTCPTAGQRLTVATDAVVKTGQLPVGVCYNPNAVGINQTSEQAKADLMQMRCNTGVNIANLDQNFAICADKFMNALRQTSPKACVRDGYRSVQQQLSACMNICGQSSCPGKCAPPGKSFHQFGLAIDVNIGSVSASQSWQIAISSTNGGITNPTGLHSSDPNHFQATGSTCSGAPVPASDTTDTYTGTQPTVAPSTTTPPPVSAQPAPATQSATAAPSPAQVQPAAQTVATTPTITPTPQLTTAVSSSSAASSLLSSLQSTPLSLFQTSTSATQALNIVTNLGSVATSGTDSLDQNLSTIVTDLISGNPTSTPQASAPVAQQQSSYPQDTFSANSQQYVSGNSSVLDQLLQPLKNLLTSLLSYLRSL